MKTASFVTGLVAGAVVGAGVTAMISPVEEKDVKNLKRNANHVWRTIGNVVDNVTDFTK
ncbi:MAG: hypothetical protein LBM38_00080 [Clostridiales bacterium]|jgi:gas vesicle protein|nr:hypothetical protein [Clostridiales bacterium]